MKPLMLFLICFLVSCPHLLHAEESFGGTGIDGVMLPDRTIIVRQIVAGGSANLAGIMVGDIITHIDGKTTSVMFLKLRYTNVCGAGQIKNNSRDSKTRR